MSRGRQAPTLSWPPTRSKSACGAAVVDVDDVTFGSIITLRLIGEFWYDLRQTSSDPCYLLFQLVVLFEESVSKYAMCNQPRHTLRMRLILLF